MGEREDGVRRKREPNLVRGWETEKLCEELHAQGNLGAKTRQATGVESPLDN